MPKPVRLAIKLIWFSLIIRVLLNLFGTVIGIYLVGTFLITFIISTLIAIIPYKLGHRSNAARYVLLLIAVLTAIGALSVFVYHVPNTILDQLDFLITIPLYIYALYFLFFNKEVVHWFRSQ
ncbi:hypothetical protein [Alkanindiges illinoisensis]|uniref:hypothetical protein n=1 Tax=Alkanindiges illinoisensis TaxID=197183 RepID=UPI0012EB688D|nr:hypothetical protein [Alkanindiges illinoisensis]